MMENWRVLCLLLLWVWFAPIAVIAQPVVFAAADDASDPAYDDSWSSGTIGGIGFGPWGLDPNEPFAADIETFGNFPPISPFLLSPNGDVFGVTARGSTIVSTHGMGINFLTPVRGTRGIFNSSNRVEGETYYFVSEAPEDFGAAARFELLNNTLETLVFIPLPQHPAQFAVSVYPSKNAAVVLITNLETGTPQTEILPYRSSNEFPARLLFGHDQAAPGVECFGPPTFICAGGTNSSTLYFNKLKYDTIDQRGFFVLTENSVTIPIGAPNSKVEATLDFDGLATPGFVYLSHVESPVQLPPGILSTRLVGQRYSLTPDNELVFDEASITLTYKEELLGNLPESQINRVVNVFGDQVKEIPCTTDIIANTVTFRSNTLGDFYIGAARNSSDLIVLH